MMFSQDPSKRQLDIKLESRIAKHPILIVCKVEGLRRAVQGRLKYCLSNDDDGSLLLLYHWLGLDSLLCLDRHCRHLLRRVHHSSGAWLLFRQLLLGCRASSELGRAKLLKMKL